MKPEWSCQNNRTLNSIMTSEVTLKLGEINVNVLAEMLYEKNRVNTFLESGQWNLLEDCNCTPDKVCTTNLFEL